MFVQLTFFDTTTYLVQKAKTKQKKIAREISSHWHQISLFTLVKLQKVVDTLTGSYKLMFDFFYEETHCFYTAVQKLKKAIDKKTALDKKEPAGRKRELGKGREWHEILYRSPQEQRAYGCSTFGRGSVPASLSPNAFVDVN